MIVPVPAEGEGARQPLVVIVDDEDQRSFAELVIDQGVEAVTVSPDDLDYQLLTRATAVVLDQYLHNWPGRDRLDLPPTLHVPDGLGLAAVLRSHVEGSGIRIRPPQLPVAFVLRTGELDRLGAGLPKAAREHLLARQYNLEWVFSKGEGILPNLPSPSGRIASLARAASSLPKLWGADSRDPGLRWLDLPGAAWAEDARWQVEQCRPPQHVVAERTAGLAWLRWFLHRILPFPTFLLDRTYLAVSLGIDIASLNGALSSDSRLAARLSELRYRGPLNDFLGDRWWRAGVSHLVAELLDLAQQDGLKRIQTVAVGAANLHGGPLNAVTVEDPVIAVNADYMALSDPISAASAVRLQPDDWPPYADDAWAARDTLSGEDADPELLALVVSTDRWRVQSDYDDAQDDPSKAITPEAGAGQRDPGTLSDVDDGKRLL